MLSSRKDDIMNKTMKNSMKVLLKNKPAFIKHNFIMQEKLANVPHKKSDNVPQSFPCVVVSFITLGVNGHQINHEFVYLADFKNKTNKT